MSLLSHLAISLLLVVCVHGDFRGGSSAWRPFYGGSYVGRPARSFSRPRTTHGPPRTGYGPPRGVHGSHGDQGGHSGARGGRLIHAYGGSGHQQQGYYKPHSCATFIACYGDHECPSGQYCSESPHLPHCGKECVPDLPNTYDCDRDYQCRSNYCAPHTHKCQLKPSPPDPCAGFVACNGDHECPVSRYCSESPHLPQCGSECVPDLPDTYDCDRDYKCQSGYCNPYTHKCQTKPSPPDPCKGFIACKGDHDCPASQYCGDSPYLSQCGKECLPDKPNTYACDRDYQCRSNYCDPVSYQCKPRPSPPDPCAGFIACTGDKSCNVNQHCAPSPHRPECGAECVPDLPHLAPCHRDNECHSGYCDPHVYLCKPRPSPCDSLPICYSDAKCAPYEHCSASPTLPYCGKQCLPDYDDMTYPCHSDNQCKSDYCDPLVGQCKPKCVGFVPCSADFDCELTEHCALSPTRPACGNECVADQPDMTSCSRNDQCDSNYCEPEQKLCKPRDTQPVPQPCCLFGFTQLGDACYSVQREPSSYDAARTVCQSQYNGDLSTVPSQEVNDLVVQLLDDVGASSAWVGITDRQTEGVFLDVNGSDQVSANWAAGRPRTSTSKNCVEVAGQGYSESGYDFGAGEWNDLNCNRERNYVCQAPLLPICPKVRR